MSLNKDVSKALDDFRRGISLSHVWVFQAYHEISAKYKRTALGSLWIAGAMVFSSLSFSVVFGALFGNNLKDNLPLIMSGLLCFNIACFPLLEAQELYLSNSGIINNHAYPFTYFAFERVTMAFFVFLHNLVVLYITIALLGALTPPHWTIIIGLPLVLINMFTWGSVVGMMSARFRDLRFLLPYIGQFMLFLTPIMYKPSQLHKAKTLLVDLNPLFPLVEMLRQPILGKPMDMNLWPMAAATTIMGIIVWAIVFTTFRKRIAFWV